VLTGSGTERKGRMKNIAPRVSSDTVIWVIKSVILLKYFGSMRVLTAFRVLKR
jgi:hypothetical protein